MIIFKNVTKKYYLSKHIDSLRNIFSFKKYDHLQRDNEFYALKDVSFEIKSGDCVGILGRNGAGKSTILKLISRITLPTDGELSLSGRVASLLEVGSGFHHELSGHDNIFLLGAILGMSSQEVSTKIQEIIDFAEIGEFIYEPVKFYSSGMSLRLAFAIGVSLDSEIFIIDEALSVGDANFQKKCLDKLNTIINSGKTIVFVSHDIKQVEKICNKTLVMKHGQVEYYGDTVEGIKHYEALLTYQN